MNPFRRTPDARFLRAMWLSQNWAAMRGNERAEDSWAYAYAKFTADLGNNLGHVGQERYMATKPVLAAVYWLMSSAPDWRASLQQRRDMGPGPVWPTHGGTPDTSINVVLQRERSIIKALVLADATPEMIARQLDYDVPVIQTFEKLCWDIRGKAQARAWLHNFVFPEGIQASIDSSDFERLIFQRAYTHGLPGVMSFLHLSGHITDHEGYTREASKLNGADFSHKTVTAIQTLTPSQRNGHEILATAMTFDKSEKELRLKSAAADVNPGDEGQDAGGKLLGRLTVVGSAHFSPADPSVPSNLGAEEHLDDSKFLETLAVVRQEVQLTK